MPVLRGSSILTSTLKESSADVKFENSKFTAKIKTGNTGELVFFSIPYEDGWSATVNGQPADVEKVNVGFMAVAVPANTESTIVFTYNTPGLMVGTIITAVGVIILAVYLILYKSPKKRKDTDLLLFDDISDSDFDDEINTLFEKVVKEKKPKKTEIPEPSEPDETPTDNANSPETLLAAQNEENEQMNSADIGQLFGESEDSPADENTRTEIH